MGNSDTAGKFVGTGLNLIELTGKVMAVAIVLLFFIVFFVFCLHLYAKWFWYRRQDSSAVPTPATNRSRALDSAAGHHEAAIASALRRGLEPSVLKSIPVLVFDPKGFGDGLECAVCLCEVSTGEKARLLPKCSHGFHVDCIDMWFESHSTCPLCRNPVDCPNQAAESAQETAVQGENQNSGGGAAAANGVSAEAPNFPTNVLIWGNETQVSTFGPCVDEGHHHHHHQGNGTTEPSSSSSPPSIGRPEGLSSVIEVPRQINDEEEHKVPMPTRLRSLKRLLSGNRRVYPPSPRNLDLEQGSRG